ncbi:hypothetical protein ACFPRL_12850 [Pseudoclavibacter helvolus]
MSAISGVIRLQPSKRADNALKLVTRDTSQRGDASARYVGAHARTRNPRARNHRRERQALLRGSACGPRRELQCPRRRGHGSRRAEWFRQDDAAAHARVAPAA